MEPIAEPGALRRFLTVCGVVLALLFLGVGPAAQSTTPTAPPVTQSQYLSQQPSLVNLTGGGFRSLLLDSLRRCQLVGYGMSAKHLHTLTTAHSYRLPIGVADQSEGYGHSGRGHL